jgi:hypothetical protein
VVDETANARDEAADEKNQVLPDQPVSPDLGQALAETQSSGGLHSPGILREASDVPSRG